MYPILLPVFIHKLSFTAINSDYVNIRCDSLYFGHLLVQLFAAFVSS